MKILIGHDGSESADAAVDDLSRAGLPTAGEALVLTIAEPWTGMVATVEPGWAPGSLEQSAIAVGATRMLAESAAKEAQDTAHKAVERVRGVLRGWEVRGETTCAPAAGALLERADGWAPDLLVVGSQGRTAVGRWLLGSVSQAVLTHARCSVRIGRTISRPDGEPPRLIVGYDGSEHSRRAARAVAARHWPAKTRVKLLTVRDVAVMSNPGPEPLSSAMLEERSQQAAAMSTAGLDVTTEDRVGDPKHVLLDAAKEWAADCLFLGARGTSMIQRLLIGSVSTTVAQRAGCSVEIVK